MATATMPRAGYSTTIRLENNIPQVFALKYGSGREVQGKFGPQTMYTAIDDRKLYLDPSDASDFDHAVLELRVKPSDFIRVTKVVYGGRGGGHSIRVERAETEPDPAPPSRIEAQLEKSVEMARTHGPKAFIAQSAPTPEPPASAKGTMGNLLTGALIASIDAYAAAAEYAKSKGIVVELRLDFCGEDIRSSATAMLIEYWRNGGTR